MELSPKAIRHLLDALTCYEAQIARRLEADGLSDEELADLDNDRRYLQALQQDLQSRHDELVGEKALLTSIAK